MALCPARSRSIKKGFALKVLSKMKLFRPSVMAVCLVIALPVVAGAWLVEEWKSQVVWPEPPKVEPGTNGSPPSDAVVLFDGTNLDQWNGGDKWKVENGVATVRKKTISTKQKFGSCQFHIEFASPAKIEGKGQGRGNSGIFFGNGYEVQVLDGYENPTYFDGQCGALYKQSPPIVNPCRKPGQWQSYDIIYDAPKFGAYGELTRPAYFTVMLNGVVIQNHVELKGRTLYNKPPTYEPHPEKTPISLQHHNNPVQYRNIWVRENMAPLQPELPDTYRWSIDSKKKKKK